jgi:serine protease AprX
MTDHRSDSTRLDRRTVLRATAGFTGAAALSGFVAGSADATTDGPVPTVDDALDTDADVLQEVLVVFEDNASVDHLRHLDLAEGYYAFSVLPIGYTVLTGRQIETVASWSDVQYVEANHDIELLNDDARDVTGVETVQEELFYTGESVHAVVVDSGVDGDHPDLQTNLQANYRFLDPLDEDTMWVDAGPVDTASNGHGTHVTGTIAGDGSESDGRYNGMAPDADVTVYSTDAVAALLNVVGAYDDMLEKQRSGEHDVQVVNNSFGASVGGDYNPNGALETATWEAVQLGILPVFAAGNSGPEPNTFSNYAAAPHVLAAAATTDEMAITDFSSRGRPPSYDGGGEGAHYDRRKALGNLQDLYAKDYSEQPVVGSTTREGTVGPGSSDAGVGSSAYEAWTVPKKAGYVEGRVSWTPQGEDIDVYLHEGSRDGPVVASGATLQNPEQLAGQVDGGDTYYLEIKPYVNVTATYTAELTARERAPGNATGPYGIYRPSGATPGNFVMSTLAPDDPFQAYPALQTAPEELDAEEYYGRLSGTSMASPVLAGTAVLVYDAYRQTHGAFPDPIEVIKLVEATANDARAGHNPWNAGSGFVDAYTAVQRAASGSLAKWNEIDLGVDGEVSEPVFYAEGARSDDGSVFTGGQTNQVTITLEEATKTARVRDEIPFDWTVVGGDDHEVNVDDGRRYVEFTDALDAGDERSYFIEAPSELTQTGEYEFGPAEAIPARGSGYWLAVTSTETNDVVAEET